MRRLLVIVSFVLGVVPGTLGAQTPHDLIVTLRDIRGQGVLATVSVRDESGLELARAQTDATGTATFAQLRESAIRVVVQGQADGITLFQDRSDAQGVRMLLTAPPARLDLRVDASGLVLPDPATMLAAEPVSVYPTALLATPESAAVVATAPMILPPVLVGAGAPPQATMQTLPTLPVAPVPSAAPPALDGWSLLVAVLWGMGMVVLLLWLGNRAGWRRR